MLWLGKEYGVTRMAMGFNNHLGSDRADFEKCAEIGREIGIEVVAVGEYPANGGVSSSKIRRLIAEGNVEAANKFLGYRYGIAGRVVCGNQIGRTIGFPTANVKVDNTCVLIPGAGVYAADVLLADGSRHRAVVNIGHRPTVDNTSALQIEAHILDFSGVIYGQKINISFIKRLRDERRFSDLTALRDQIALDIAQARSLIM
ncbi:MAG: riboflavin biosynthesis protein RibF, partial [Muribaculaceae bacterium]|nr:riboflavin biosynthesis protein RibF [Muribaculaceae bacterium]